ncbi:recombinase family protein [Pseudophaeobacter arcticus]|jgi:site-specific DNA recombinase|uniref:recombinase family protein n=1 Tax=Pseudophaeobacter arcticus TaxID=385492 RepID=UPI0039E2D638
MKRAAIYARYSSSLQKATSIEDQIAMGKRYCAAQGLTLVETFVDRELTGRNARRPGLIEMKAALQAGKIDIVIVEALDRLTRRVADALNFYDLAQFSGVALYSLTEGSQDFYKVLLGGFGAQQFSEMISVHTRRGMQGAVTRGRLHTSAYGYRKRDVTEGLNREIEQDEAAIVRRIFRETAEGRSARDIAIGLNRDGVAAPRGGTWDGSTIRGNKARHEGILNNRLYIGEASVCKTGRRYHPDTGERAFFPTEADTVTEIYEELRIVPQNIWDAAQSEIAKRSAVSQNAGNSHKARRSKHLLTGLVFCGRCGQPYVKVGRTRFGCREARKRACENRVTIAQVRIESRACTRLRQVLSAPDMIAGFEAAFRAEMRQLEGEDTESALKTAGRNLAKVQKARRGIMTAIENGADFADYSARDAELKAEAKSLEVELADLKARQSAKARPAPDIPTLFAQAIDDLEALLGRPDTVTQANEHLAALVGRVTLTPDKRAEDGLAIEIATHFAALRTAAGIGGEPV